MQWQFSMWQSIVCETMSHAMLSLHLPVIHYQRILFALVFSFMYCWVLFFALSPFYIFRACSRWCMDKLGVFYAYLTSMSWSTSEIKVRLAPWNRFRPSSKIFYWLLKSNFFCGSFVLFMSCVCHAVCSLLPCGQVMAKGWPLGSRLWWLIVFLSLSHVVSWVRCGTWLYRFMIFASFLTLEWHSGRGLEMSISDLFRLSKDCKPFELHWLLKEFTCCQ